MQRRSHHRHRQKTKTSDERIGRVFETRVERIVPGGMGIAHAEGHTLLVALATPGDLVEVEVGSVRGQVCFTHIQRIIEPSPVRVEPPCPFFGDPHRCGGCDFQQLTYEAQLTAKIDIIRDALRRTGGIAAPPPLDITPAPRPWGYRSRAEWQHDAGRKVLGYYERGSHRICDVTHCPVVAPGIERTLENLRGVMAEKGLSGDVVEFRAMAGDDERVTLSPPPDDNYSSDLQRTIRGETYDYSADCFFQINHDLLPALITEALRPVEETVALGGEINHADADARYEFALDLYCGVGLFTVPLARLFRRVIGVEAHTISAGYAARNLKAAKLAAASVETSAVKDWLLRHASCLPPVGFVLLDPPRAGAEMETIKSLVSLRPARIGYVSCDPVTLARDLKMLLAGGFALDSLHAFDLFPQTHHVETVAHLTYGA